MKNVSLVASELSNFVLIILAEIYEANAAVVDLIRSVFASVGSFVNFLKNGFCISDLRLLSISDLRRLRSQLSSDRCTGLRRV